MENNNELLVVICNYSYVEEVMEVAKQAGAKGGTILHGVGTDAGESKVFFNIKIQPEKSIILIITKKENKDNIMKSVSEKMGVNTEAHAISFSLPVDDILGITL